MIRELESIVSTATPTQTDAEIADLLNTVQVEYQPITLAWLNSYIEKKQITPKLEAAAAQTVNPQLAYAAKAGLRLFSAKFDSIDPRDPDARITLMAMLDILKAGGVITPGQYEEILSMAIANQYTSASRVGILQTVTAEDVKQARQRIEVRGRLTQFFNAAEILIDTTPDLTWDQLVQQLK
jgi:hypothetical protein